MPKGGWILAMMLGVAVSLPTLPVGAGTASDPEITDVAGDANMINGQGLAPGLEETPDTRPASVDSMDLISVRFETSYDSRQIRDSEEGPVLRVEHVPVALLVHIETQGPVRPTAAFTGQRYIISSNLPGCRAWFVMYVSPDGSSDDTAFRAIDRCGSLQEQEYLQMPADPLIEGSTSTLTFPFDFPKLDGVVEPGITISQPVAYVINSYSTLGPAPQNIPRYDETAPGRAFVIGQDVPPDIDCISDPDHPGCQP